MRIAKRTVDALKPDPSRRQYVFDDKLDGFGVVVQPSGAISYIYEYRPGAGGRATQKRRFTIGRHGSPWTPDSARKRAEELQAAVLAGRDPAAEKKAGRRRGDFQTVNDVYADWMAKDQATNRSVERVRRAIELEVLPFVGGKPIDELTKADILDVIDRVSARAPVRANRVLAHVKRMTRWAASRDIIAVDPATTIQRPTQETSRARVLADDELALIWSALNGTHPVYAAGVRTLVLTGARRDEVFRALWSEFDERAGVLNLPAERSKTGNGRAIPLCAQAVEIIATLPRLNDFIFTTGTQSRNPDHGDSSTSWGGFSRAKVKVNRAIARKRRDEAKPGRAGSPLTDAELQQFQLPDWRLHDIRRTVATGCQRLGVRLEVTETLLGHIAGSRSGVVGVYQRHAFEAETRAAAELWGAHVHRIGTGDAAPETVIQFTRPG